MNRSVFIYIFFLLGFLVSCDNEEAEIPSYLYVEEVVVETNSDQGTSDLDLEHIYLYYDNNFLGVYPIPGLIPIFAEGSQEVEMDFGVYINGNLETPAIYRGLKRNKSTYQLKRGVVDTITVTTTYKDNAVVVLSESFEFSTGFGVIQDDFPGSDFEVTREEAYEGTGAGTFRVTEDQNQVRVLNDFIMDLPADGRKVYLEMHYKNPGFFSLFLSGYDNGDYLGDSEEIILYPNVNSTNDGWRKIIFDLTPILIQSGLSEYRLKIAHNYNKSQVGNIYIDNLKLLHL